MMEQYREEFEKQCKPQGDCIVWTGAKFSSGGGKFRVDGRYASARRVAWALSGGILSDRYIQTTCGNPDCVHPDHLFSTDAQCGPEYEDYSERLAMGQRMIDGEMDDDVRLNRVRALPRRGLE